MSINVAKNGPAEKAGSILRRFNKKGVQLPSTTETITIDAREIEIVTHSINDAAVHQARKKANNPKITASTQAMSTSRRMNRLKFASCISPEANP